MKASSENKGLSVVEIVVAAAIVLIVVTAASQVWQLYFKVTRTSSEKTQSALLTEEVAEYIGTLRNRSWNNLISPLPLNTPIYVRWNGSSYATSTTPIPFKDGYSVRVTFYELMRNTDQDIVLSGGFADPKSRHMKIEVGSENATNIFTTTDLLIHDLFQN